MDLKELVDFKNLPAQLSGGNSGEIISFLANHQCNLSEQAYVLSRGKTAEIIQLISHNGLCVELHYLLVKRGIHEEIMALLDTQELQGDSAIIALSERGDVDENAAFMHRYRNNLRMRGL